METTRRNALIGAASIVLTSPAIVRAYSIIALPDAQFRVVVKLCDANGFVSSIENRYACNLAMIRDILMPGVMEWHNSLEFLASSADADLSAGSPAPSQLLQSCAPAA